MKTQRTFVQDLKPGQRFFIGNQSLDLFEGIEKPGRCQSNVFLLVRNAIGFIVGV